MATGDSFDVGSGFDSGYTFDTTVVSPSEGFQITVPLSSAVMAVALTVPSMTVPT